MSDYIFQSLEDSLKTLTAFLQSDAHRNAIKKATDLMITSLKSGGKIITCGNGGSMCDSMHFSEELTGRYRKDRRPLAAISLTEAAHISCVSNDFGYDHIFSRQVEALAKKEDVLLAISTSGNSPNVLKACEEAKKIGTKIVALSGKDGGKLKEFADVSIIVNSNMTDRIQEIHIKCIHIMIEGIERNLFPEHYR
jgi:D-sedoheptulose 7-phosphate isomerase